MASKRSILRKVMVGAMKAPDWFEGTFGATTTTTTTADITPISTPTLESVATATVWETVKRSRWVATPATPTDTTTTTTTAATTATETTTITADASMKKAALVTIAEEAGHDVTGMTKTQILDLLQG